MYNYLDSQILNEEEIRTLKELIETQPPNQQQIESVFGCILEFLSTRPIFKNDEKQKTKFNLLDILTKNLIQNLNNPQILEQLFEKLLEILQKDNVENAIPAKQALLDIIKKAENRQQNLDNQFDGMYKYLQDRTQFLIEVCKNRAQVNNQLGALDDYEIKPNYLSVNFLKELPNLFIYGLNFLDIRNNHQINQYLQFSIQNILQAIKYFCEKQDQERVTSQQETKDTFIILTKMFQFISIILRQDFRNRNYSDNAKELINYIKPEDLSKAFIRLLKNCDEDSKASCRIDLINSFKALIKNIGRDKYKDLQEIYEENIIFGTNNFLCIYAKNAIFAYWLDIILLLNPQDNNSSQINKILDMCFKNLFDNTLQLQTQKESLKLIKQLIDQIGANRNLDQTKRQILMQIQQKIEKKFKQIKNTFIEIAQYILKKYGTQYPQPQKRTLYIKSLSQFDPYSEDFNKKKIEYIENSEIDINYYLLTSTSCTINTLQIYEEEDFLIINCLIINDNTYSDYMQETKELIIVQLIDIINKILQQLQQHYQQDMRQQQRYIKLNDEECEILSNLFKYGLQVFEFFHDFKLHIDDKIKPFISFMIQFSSIQDPINFRDIIEKNMPYIFKYLLKYSRECFDTCLQNFLLIPFFSQPHYQQNLGQNHQQQLMPAWKNYTEILIKFLLEKLKDNPDNLDPSSPYYDYKDNYQIFFFKLIRIPMKILNKFNDESFFKPIIKQLILILIKKIHTSLYPLEYLQLLRILFKNVTLFNKFDNLNLEFQNLCQKQPLPLKKGQDHVKFNVNITENFVNLYDSGIDQIQQIVTEIVLLMPLKSKTQIQLAKQGLTSKILINSLKLSEYNIQTRSLKTFDIIIQNLNHKELKVFLDGQKETLLDNLFKIVQNNDNKQDIQLLAIKLLGKLGHIVRHNTKNIEIQIPKQLENIQELQFKFQDNQITFELSYAIQNAYDKIMVYHKYNKYPFQNYNQQVTPGNQLDIPAKFLQTVFVNIMNEQIITPQDSMNKIIEGLVISLNYYNNNQTLKTQIEQALQKSFSDIFVLQEIDCNKKFINSIFDSVYIKSIIIREETQSIESYSFTLVSDFIKKNESENFILIWILEQIINLYQNECINKKLAYTVLIRKLIDIIPLSYLQKHQYKLISSCFQIINTATDIIRLQIVENAKEIIEILCQDITNNEQLIISILTFNLITYKEVSTQTAIKCLTQIYKKEKLDFIELLYDQNLANIPIQNNQVQHLISDIKKDKNSKSPIYKILKTLLDNLNQCNLNDQNENVQNNKLKILNSCFITLEFLISQNILPFKIIENNTLDPDFMAIVEFTITLLKMNQNHFKSLSSVIQEESSDQDCQQNASINQNSYIDDQDCDINIYDIDLNIQVWSNTVCSAMNFMKAILSFPQFIEEYDKKENSPLVNLTFQFFYIFFDMIMRVESKIKKTAFNCIKTLWKQEQYAKYINNNDERYKQILKPVLKCLQQPFDKFTPNFLKMFKYLLKIISRIFNNQLSEKLIDHLQTIQQRRTISNVEQKCISNLLKLFQHFCIMYKNTQQYPMQVLENIIKQISKIDHIITQSNNKTCSITKYPFLKFLNKISTPTFNFFIKKENLLEYGKLFLEILKLDQAIFLRERFTRDSDILVQHLLSLDTDRYASYRIGLQIIRVLSKKCPRWLLNNKNIVVKVYNNWKELYQRYDSNNSRFILKNEYTTSLKIIVDYCKICHNDFTKIFSLLECINQRKSYDFSFIYSFYKYYIFENFTNEEKKAIFLYFLDYCENPKNSLKLKVSASFQIIYPLLIQHDKTNFDFFDEACIERLYQFVKIQDHTQINQLDVEILQIFGVLMKHFKEEFLQLDRKTKLIKFCWEMFKSEDKTIKSIAYIFASKFIITFGLPIDKVIQIYISLLKSQDMNQHDNDSKILSRKALDILIPYLPQTVESPQESDDITQYLRNTSSWITWTYRIFNEDSFIMNNFSLSRFWHIFIKNHSVYYVYRRAFSTQMINSMQYILLSSNQNPLNKKIASDLSFIYIEWVFKELREKMAQVETFEEKQQILDQMKDDQCREIFLNFFIKLAINNNIDKTEKEVIKRSLYLLKKLFIIWPELRFRLESLYRYCINLSSRDHYNVHDRIDKQKFNYTLLNILNTLLQYEKIDNLPNSLDNIISLLSVQRLNNSFYDVNDNPYLIKLMISIIEKMSKILTLQHERANYFLEFIQSQIDNGLRAYCSASTGINQIRQPQITIYITIKILYLLFQIDENYIGQHLPKIQEVADIFINIFKQKNVKGLSLDESEDLLGNIDENFDDENYEKQKYIYLNMREFLVILLRILATKFNQISPNKQIQLVENVFLEILEKIPDYDLKVEILSILKCLFVQEYQPYPYHSMIKKALIDNAKKSQWFLNLQRIARFMRLFENYDERGNRVQRLLDDTFLYKYSHFITSIINIDPIPLTKLRDIIVLLTAQNNYSANYFLFNLIDQQFGNSLKDKILFIFAEFENENQKPSFLFILNYLAHHFRHMSTVKLLLPNKQQQVNSDNTDEIAQRYFELVQNDSEMKLDFVQYIWDKFVQTIYQISNKQNKDLFLKVMENYLCRNQQQQFSELILRSFSYFQKDYQIQPEKLMLLAKNNKCWFTSLQLLEFEFLDVNASNYLSTNYLFAIRELLQKLNDQDSVLGLSKIFLSNPKIVIGLQFIQMKDWLRAYKEFTQLLQEFNVQFQNEYFEQIDQAIAEEGWINVLKNLNKWDLLDDLAKNQDYTDLKIECAWQRKDFTNIENLIAETPNKTSLTDIILISSKLDLQTQQNECTNMIQNAFVKIIQECQQLPVHIAPSHQNVLLNIQILMEIEDSHQLMMKLKESQQNQVNAQDQIFRLQELIQIIQDWRERLPHKNENLIIWKNIIEQRNFIYNIIKSKLKGYFSVQLKNLSDQEIEKQLQPFNDINWNNLRYIKEERHYDIYSSIFRFQVDDSLLMPQELFIKAKEKLISMIQTKESEENFIEQLNQVQNHENYTDLQKAEILRLKGQFYLDNLNNQHSNSSLMESLSLQDTCKAWYLWESFCTNFVVYSQKIEWIMCVIQALVQSLKFKQQKNITNFTAFFFALNYVQQENFQEHQNEIFDAVDQYPIMIWLNWLANLQSLIMDQGFLAELAQHIYKKVANAYPEIIFYHLRGGISTNEQNNQQGTQGIQYNMNEFYKQLKQGPNGMLFQRIKSFYKKLKLGIANDQIYIQYYIYNNLKLILRNFSEPKQVLTKLIYVFQILKDYHFDRYQKNYIALNFGHFNQITNPNQIDPQILKSFIQKVLHIMDKFNPNLYRQNHIEIHQYILSEIHTYQKDIVIPDAIPIDQEPNSKKQIRVQEVNQKFEIIQQNSQLRIIIKFKGSDFKLYSFLYFYEIQNQPEYNRQLKYKNQGNLCTTELQNMNICFIEQYKKFLNAHLEVTKFNNFEFQISNNNIFYLNSSEQLVPYNENVIYLDDILLEYEELNRIDFINTIQSFRNISNNTERKIQIYKQMCKLIPEDLMKKYLLKKIDNPEKYYIVRKQFCQSFGLVEFFSNLISDNSVLQYLKMDVSTGKVYQENQPLKHTFSQSFFQFIPIQSIRLTRNFVNYMTEYNVQGAFAQTILISTQAISQKTICLKNYINIFVKEYSNMFHNEQQTEFTFKVTISYYKKVMSFLKLSFLISDTLADNKSLDQFNHYLNLIQTDELHQKIMYDYKPWF